MNATAKKHLDAIRAGTVTKSNVIGIRKALNHVARLRNGYSGNRSSVTPEEADDIETALNLTQPRVTGELHESGLALLRSKRYAKRFDPAHTAIIANLKEFRLVRFDRIDRGLHAVPVYMACAGGPHFFYFRNIPWQTADAYGEESGPVLVGRN